MKKLIVQFMLLFISLMLIASCSTTRVSISSNYGEKIDTIALISTFIGMQKPVLPLVDAAIINGKVNKIAGEIMPMFGDKINILRENVAVSLMKNLNCKILYGEELQTKEGYEYIKKNIDYYDALYTNDKNFPEIVSAEKDVNPFDFNKGRIIGYFDDQQNFRISVAKICNALKINYIVVSYTFLYPIPNMFMSTISTRTFLRIFNKNGECIIKGSNYTKPEMFEPGYIAGYENAVDMQNELLQPIVEKIAVKLKN